MTLFSFHLNYLHNTCSVIGRGNRNLLDSAWNFNRIYIRHDGRKLNGYENILRYVSCSFVSRKFKLKQKCQPCRIKNEKSLDCNKFQRIVYSWCTTCIKMNLYNVKSPLFQL